LRWTGRWISPLLHHGSEVEGRRGGGEGKVGCL
jgi:hypothetical protein